MLPAMAVAAHIKTFTGDKEEKTHLQVQRLKCCVPQSHSFNWLARVAFPTLQKSGEKWQLTYLTLAPLLSTSLTR